MESARRIFISAAALWAGSMAPQAFAYTPTITPKGAPVKWQGEVRLNFAGNPTNSSGISEPEFFSAVVHGLQRWNEASAGAVKFDYWQGTDATVYTPDSDFNGLSSIYFASNAKSTAGLNPNVLGLTQVWYDTGTGEILETDVVLNDLDFHFTTNPQDSSGYGSESPAAFNSRNHVFIENVITHELGHALGLSHSGGLQSTMLFMESPEQAHLGCDEAVAIHALYPSGGDGARGSIGGSVVAENGAPVFGAHVLAISRRRGTVLATAMTDKSGNYQIRALEPGAYFLMVEPFFAGAAPLPAYYSDINAAVCPGGKPFGRSLLTDSSGYNLQSIQVGVGQGVGAPVLTARCGQGAGASIVTIPRSSRDMSAPQIYDGPHDSAQGSGGFGATDRLGSNSSAFYRLHLLSGDVEIHALAYSLYSPIQVKVELLNLDGSPVDSRTVDPSYVGESGFVNYDTYLTAKNLPPGDYMIEVSAKSLDASLYPAGPVSLDSQPFLVITGSVNEPGPSLSGALATNPRCRSSEEFADYSSPPGPPPRTSTEARNHSEGVGFCGTLSQKEHQKGPGPFDDDASGDGPSAGAIAGWFAPWIFMVLSAGLFSLALRSRRLRALVSARQEVLP